MLMDQPQARAGEGAKGQGPRSALAPGLMAPIRLTGTLGLPRSGDTETSVWR